MSVISAVLYWKFVGFFYRLHPKINLRNCKKSADKILYLNFNWKTNDSLKKKTGII